MCKPVILLGLLLLFRGIPCQAQSDLVAKELQEGIKLFGEKEYKKAESKFQTVLRATRRRNPQAHYFLARIYLEAEALRDTNKAQSHYDNAKKYRLKFKDKIEKIAVLEEKGGRRRPDISEVIDRLTAEAKDEEKDENVPAVGETAPQGDGEPSAEAGKTVETVEISAKEEANAAEESPPASGAAPEVAKADRPVRTGTPSSSAAEDERASRVVDRTESTETSRTASREPARRTSTPGDTEEMTSPRTGFREPVSPPETASTDQLDKYEDRLVLAGSTEDAAAKLDSRLGECLRKEQRGEDLDFGCEYNLHVFRIGTLMCQRKIDKGLYEEAEQYARDVINIAPQFWQGYWLRAYIFLRKGDIVTAEDWWKLAKARRFVAAKNFFDLDPFILKPKDALRNALITGRQLMDNEDWIAAEDALIAVQDINFKSFDDVIDRMLAEVYFRIGEISYHLQDYEVAIQYMEYGIEEGYRRPGTEQLLADARKWADYEWPVDPRPLTVLPIQFPEIPKAFGSVHLDLGGRGYLEVSAHTKEGKKRLDPTKKIDIHTYSTAGGRAYDIDFNVRRQLRKALLHGGSAVLFMGILLML